MTYESPAEVTLTQGSYWKPVEDVVVDGLLHSDDGLDTDNPIVIPAATVMLLQSIRDVDNTAHTVILRPHPSVYGMDVYKVSTTYSSFPGRSWTPGELTEVRFLVADFLLKFVPAFDFEQVCARELADAQEHVRQLQLRLTEGQNNPKVMCPVLMLGLGEWEKEKNLNPEQVAPCHLCRVCPLPEERL
jgi:hypothetical protein